MSKRPMFSHVFIGISDFERALAFYTPLLQALGLVQTFCDPSRPWAGWQVPGSPRPLLVIASPFNRQGPHPGNGTMVALMAATREQVRQFHALALKHGGTSEGTPGLRPEYHPHYYGAYVRDPDGNKLAVACHQPEPSPQA